MKREKKNQICWIIAMTLLISMMAVTAAGCGAKKNKAEDVTAVGSAAVTTPSEGELSKEDLKVLEDLKLIAGIRDYTIEAGTKLKTSDLISFNKDYISQVEVKDDKVDYSKPGKYSLKYVLSMDAKKIQKLAKEKNKTFAFNTDKGKKAFVVCTNTVLAKGDPAVANNKDAVTEATVKNIIAANAETLSKQEGKTAKNNTNAAQNPNDVNAAANTNNQNTQNNNNAYVPTQETAPVNQTPVVDNPPAYVPTHQHSFDTMISETAATCFQPGEIVRQCSCGEIYTETTPRLQHDWVYVPFVVDRGNWVVEEGKSYEEGHWEPLIIDRYQCTRCTQTSVTPFN